MVKFLKSTSSNLLEIFKYNFFYLYVAEDNLQITVVCKLLNIKKCSPVQFLIDNL